MEDGVFWQPTSNQPGCPRRALPSLAASRGSSSWSCVSGKPNPAPSSLLRSVLSLGCVSAERQDCPRRWPFASLSAAFSPHPLQAHWTPFTRLSQTAQESAPSPSVRSQWGIDNGLQQMRKPKTRGWFLYCTSRPHTERASRSPPSADGIATAILG